MADLEEKHNPEFGIPMMPNARKTAVELIEAAFDALPEDQKPNPFMPLKLKLMDSVEQALLAAGPRVVDEVKLDSIINDWVDANRDTLPIMSQVNGFEAGFRAAASMNALAHLESVMPNEDEWWAALKEFHYDGKNMCDIPFINGVRWLRAEVLRRLGGK